MDSNIIEVYNDFQNALSNINFAGYNPNSEEFLTALHLGIMWYILNQLSEKDIDIAEMKSEDDISEEFQGAKKYMQMYIDTRDEIFKNMAKDELNHASILIKKAGSRLPAGEEKMKLKNYEEIYKELLAQTDNL